MNEREGHSNQGDSELILVQSGLTYKALNPKLGGGDIFMTQEGVDNPQPSQANINQGPKTPEETVAHLARVGAKRELDQSQVPVGELPLGFETWPIDLQKAFREEQRDRLAAGIPQQPSIVPEVPPPALSFGRPTEETFPDQRSLTQEQFVSLSNFRREATEQQEQAIRDDIELMWNLDPQELTPEAKTYLMQFAKEIDEELEKGEKPQLTITNELKQVLLSNGISQELIDKYKDEKPEVLVAMLVARNEVHFLSQLKPLSDPEEIEAEREEVESPPLAKPATHEPEEPIPDASLSEVEKRMAQQRLERAGSIRKLLAPIRELYSGILSDKESRRNLEEGLSRDLGRPFKVEDVDSFMRGIMPSVEEMEAMIARDQEERRTSREPIYVPNSLEELAQLVMNRATPEYRLDDGTGHRGEKCLFNEDGSVSTVHFLDWARKNYMLTHLNSPTTEVDFFSGTATNVRTEGLGSVISFGEITFTESYFLKDVRDSVTGEVTHREHSDEYQALREQMLWEVYLLQLQRNPAVMYVLNQRAEREKMLNALVAANVLNPLTRGDFVTRILTMPSMQAKTILDLDPTSKGRELLAKLDGNFAMGTATREALAAYINITDYEMLVKILGKDAVLFTYEYEKYDSWTGERDKDGKMNETALDVDAAEKRAQWFYSEEDVERLRAQGITVRRGDVKLYKIKNGKKGEEDPRNGQPDPEFMKYVNVYLTPTPDQRQQDEMRERIRLSIMKRNGISYREAQIAELMAYSMSQINGVAARNDTDSVGFDWWTRVTNFLDKRKREKSPTRNASYGSEFNMEGVKRIGLNFFEAARDIRGRSVRKIIQGGEGGDVHIQDDPLKNTVAYERGDVARPADANGEGEVRYIKFYAVYDHDDPSGHFKKGDFQKDVDGNYMLVEDSSHKVTSYAIEESGVVFKDIDGNLVNIDPQQAMAKVEIEKVSDPIEFEQDVQKQFLPNHLMTAAEIYQWVFERTGYNLPELVIGRDARNEPILDWKKLDAIKHGIDHDIRYAISTWGKINFGERHREWEQVEIRDDQGRLQGKVRQKDGTNKIEALDDDYYVLDKFGRRTGKRADPEKYLQIREMSRLESMFGYPALVYIKKEIERHGLSEVKIKRRIEDGSEQDLPDEITVKDPKTGESITLNIAAATNPEYIGKFRIAVFQGVIDYYKAAEIEEHRTFGSGVRHYDFMDTTNLKAALVAGGLAEPEQVELISDQTDIGNIKLFLEKLGFDTGGGAFEGVFKSLTAIVRATVAE